MQILVSESNCSNIPCGQCRFRDLSRNVDTSNVDAKIRVQEHNSHCCGSAILREKCKCKVLAKILLEESHNLLVAVFLRRFKCSAPLVAKAPVRPLLQENLNHVRVSFSGGNDQGRRSIVVGLVDTCLLAQKEYHHVPVDYGLTHAPVPMVLRIYIGCAYISTQI